jgi:hypothetical protein
MNSNPTGTIHPYYTAKARACLAKHGVALDNVDQLAAWAQDHRDDTAVHGVIVGVDGEIMATTVHQENAIYVDDEGIKRWGLLPHELGFALGQIKRAAGRDVVHIRRSELCTGHAPR